MSFSRSFLSFVKIILFSIAKFNLINNFSKLNIVLANLFFEFPSKSSILIVFNSFKRFEISSCLVSLFSKLSFRFIFWLNLASFKKSEFLKFVLTMY
ncbi:hypothetical protein ABC503_03265 [Mycoplasmopsis synoviae]